MKTSSLIVHINQNWVLWMVLALVSKMEFEVPSCVRYRSLENTTIVKKRDHTQTGKQLVLCTLYTNKKSKPLSLKSVVHIILLRVQNIL